MIIYGYNIPNILLYLGALLIVAVVYFTADDYFKATMRKYIIKFLPWVILIGIMIYGWNNWGVVSDHESIANMKFALFLAMALGLLYLVAKNYLYEHRYETTPFQANGVYGSCARYYDVGKYTIFYLGTSGKSAYKGFIIPWFWAKKICVVPKESWQFVGEGIVSTAQVSKFDISQLPEKVRRYIESDILTYFARDEIHLGLFSEELRTNDPSVDEIESRFADFNLQNTLQKQMIEGKNTMIKKHVTDTEAVKNKLKGSMPMQIRQNPTGED